MCRSPYGSRNQFASSNFCEPFLAQSMIVTSERCNPSSMMLLTSRTVVSTGSFKRKQLFGATEGKHAVQQGHGTILPTTKFCAVYAARVNHLLNDSLQHVRGLSGVFQQRIEDGIANAWQDNL